MTKLRKKRFYTNCTKLLHFVRLEQMGGSLKRSLGMALWSLCKAQHLITISFICDMHGVIYHGDRLVDGLKEFVTRLKREDLALFPYHPDYILNRAADILNDSK
jgi:hypothetical protein